jgi:hypothetical protein
MEEVVVIIIFGQRIIILPLYNVVLRVFLNYGASALIVVRRKYIIPEGFFLFELILWRWRRMLLFKIFLSINTSRNE